MTLFSPNLSAAFFLAMAQLGGALPLLPTRDVLFLNSASPDLDGFSPRDGVVGGVDDLVEHASEDQHQGNDHDQVDMFPIDS